MVKLKAGNNASFGLTDENLRRLKEGEPIQFNMNELGFPDMVITIFHGKTEQSIYESVKHKIHPFKTVFKNDRAEDN